MPKTFLLKSRVFLKNKWVQKWKHKVIQLVNSTPENPIQNFFPVLKHRVKPANKEVKIEKKQEGKFSISRIYLFEILRQKFQESEVGTFNTFPIQNLPNSKHMFSFFDHIAWQISFKNSKKNSL